MRDFCSRYTEFYRLIDDAYLGANGKQFLSLRDKLEGILNGFREEFHCNKPFENEAKREVFSRLLLFSIDKDLGISACLNLWQQLKQFELDEPTCHWLILCQVSRYFRKYKKDVGVLPELFKLKTDLEIELDGIQESMRQVSAEIECWRAIIENSQTEMNDDNGHD